MGKVIVSNIRVFAHHGCLNEESIVGSEYTVDVHVDTDLTKPSITDDLSDTVDYVQINHIVKIEMQTASKLLEHVAKRIVDRIINEIQMVDFVEVFVSKINPPIGGDVEKVTISLSAKRS
ncbi:dihydroneopterin aldolase [Aurantibacter sp.]|uniref:dihydroneopterin aldolase n=1 Tax=Aurantibacter sp. TaxID=2807103 RepID=UPI0032656C3A